MVLFLIASCNADIKTDYYENGNVKLEYETSDGQINGYWKQYDSLGQLLEEAYYEEGKLDGHFISYFSNQNKKEEYWFSKGLLHGTYAKYHKNGKASETGNYISDTLNGEISTFDSLGNLITIQTACMGTLCGTYMEYYPNGQLYSSATYGANGTFNGPIKIYFQNGKLQEEGMNLNGKVNGKDSEYDSTGNLIKITEYFKKENREM